MKPPYKILIHAESYRALQDYKQLISSTGRKPGKRLQQELQGQELSSMGDEKFLEHLVNTKEPCIFAEMAVFGDGRDWNPDEMSILGDIGVAVQVEVFDDGRHRDPEIHGEPFQATLLFVAGALLRNGRDCPPADWHVVTAGGKIDRDGYRRLCERRLLPALAYANGQAGAEGKQALVTMPGLGCGQFAGPFRGRMGGHLRDAMVALLDKHAANLPNIKAVYFDPFDECANERLEFGGLSLMVRPLTQGNHGKPQLCPPSHYAEQGDDFGDCLLFSIVAWDHNSWPGNDFYGGSRATDDGTKSAATSSMRSMTGIEGSYNSLTNTYDPPDNYRDWEQVVHDLKLRITVEGNLVVLPPVA